MAEKFLYSIHKVKDPKTNAVKYRVGKISEEDYEPVGEYLIVPQGGNTFICSCPAKKFQCRHVKMLKTFQKAWDGNDPVFDEASEGGTYSVMLDYVEGGQSKWRRGISLID